MTRGLVSLASSGDSESEGGLTPPPLKRARLSVHCQAGEPSFALSDRNSAASSSLPLNSSTSCVSHSSLSNSSSGSMSGPSRRLSSKSDVGQRQQSNGVTVDSVEGGGTVAMNGDSGLVNGVSGGKEREVSAERGVKQHVRARKVPQRRLTGMDADIVRLIGQHLRELGFRWVMARTLVFTVYLNVKSMCVLIGERVFSSVAVIM